MAANLIERLPAVGHRHLVVTNRRKAGLRLRILEDPTVFRKRSNLVTASLETSTGDELREFDVNNTAPAKCYNQTMIVSATTPENRFLTDASWEDYNRYLEAVGDRRIRVTYDGTMLELMTPSPRHEYLKTILHDFVVCIMEETETDFICGGNTTFKQTLIKKGLEPDDCFWIASWPEVVGGWDSKSGPPPDLAIEVEITSSALDRVSIYVALGVPELWRVNEAGTISIWELTDAGYQARQSSPSLPRLPIEFVNEHLGKTHGISMMRLLKAFRQAVRELPPPS